MGAGAPKARTPSVRRSPAGEEPRLELDLGLCLSGGGFRAMLFHAGALSRLNEAGYLPRLDRVSSVSGGSITAGMLALSWAELDFTAEGVAPNFAELVLEPLRRFASRTVDVPAVLMGLLLPGFTVNGRLANSYRRLSAGARSRPCRSARTSCSTRPTFSLETCGDSPSARRATGAWAAGRRRTPKWPAWWRRPRPSRPCSPPRA